MDSSLNVEPLMVSSANSTINHSYFVFFSGERLSNTLVFELRYQWTGLLVEANPYSYRQLREKHRK